MIGPYTVAQLLAGSIQILLNKKLTQNTTASKLLYIIYGHFDDTYRQCWDILRSKFDNEIALVSIEQLSDTRKDLYPSGRHTVIHYRNTAQIPVLCFDNGNFEGYGTSLGKIERIGNQVTGEIASCLLEWIIQNALTSGDNQKSIVANFLQNKHNKNCSHVLQILFDTVKPHLENVAAYLNALYHIPELTQEMWGEQLYLLGLFRDSRLFETASASSRSILDNYTLSQIGYWQRETSEHIKTSSLSQVARATLLSVLADSTRLTQARQKLEFSEIRALITRPRRNAEQIALDLIRLDLESVLRNRASDDELQNLAQNILEFYRGNIQNGMMISLSNMELQQEDIQHFITYLGQKTITAIKKALAQQIPLITTNLFLGILQCLLVWKDEQDNRTSQTTPQAKHSKISRGSRLEKLSVMGIQLFPNSSQEIWKELISKVDLQIREKWEELILDNAKREVKTKQKDVKGLSGKKKRNKDRDRKLPVTMSQNVSFGQANEDFQEDAQTEDPLFEQINDLENSESNPILLNIDVRIETSARGEEKFYSASFHLEYDPIETLMLQSLIATVPTEITDSGNQSRLDEFESMYSPKIEGVGNSCSLAWACLSETTLSTDLRSIGLAMMKKSAIIQGIAPSAQQLLLPGVRNLYASFAELTKDMRENNEGLGYFSTFLFSNLPSFLIAYANLMLEARNTEQDEFDSSYGTWISQLFTLNLQEVKRTHFTHVVTPLHPLQLRWRQTYEQLLASHIETACRRPQLLDSDFINELVNLRPVGIPRVLTTREGQRNKPSSGSNLYTDPNSQISTEGGNLSYPGASSKTDLFTGYSTVLQGLQKLPSELARKIEQFFRIYPSTLDRAHISVISPVNIEIESSLSRIFEDLQQRYHNAGFFVQLFSPDSVETVSIGAIKKPRRRYDEDQGELRVRTRHHLFPRTEFVTLRQDLLKTSNGRKFLFADRAEPTQHMFILLDHLGVEMQTYEIPLEARKCIREYVDQIEQHTKSRSLGTTLRVMKEQAGDILVEERLDPLTILLHQGQEVFEEIYQLWTRGLVDNHDAYSLLYYALIARSQGHPDSIYRYVCKLSQSNAEELGTASLIKTLHKHGIWVAIIDRAITREFFRTSQSDEKNLILIDFHKGIGPQREYNLTISSTWTERVRENVQIALQQILQDTNLEYQYFDRPGLASAIMRQLQDISGGLALQLAATDANTKGLLGLLVTALEATGRIESTSDGISPLHEASDSHTAVIPLDDHNDWFEREEVRTDLLVIRFDMKEVISELHLYFALIECKFDESIQRASKGFDQLEETAKRLGKRFVNDAPDYAFRLRDLAEAIRSLAKTYRGGLPDNYVELLRTSDKQIHLHVNEGEVSKYLCLYQIVDRLAEVKDICDQKNYRLLSDSCDTLAETNMKSLGEKACYYRSSRSLGQTFDRLIRWISKDAV